MGALKNHPGMWMRDDAAAAVNAMEDKHGVIIINRAGQTEAQQQSMIDKWDRGDRAGMFEPKRPARLSDHVRDGGIGVDVYNYIDDREKLEEFGFKWYGPKDPVHYTFMGWTPPTTTITGAEMYIIHSPKRAKTLVGPGYIRVLNAEEAENIGAIVSKVTELNDRQYDLCVSAATTGTVSGPIAGPFIASSPNRAATLISQGEVRELNEEERKNAAGLFTNRVYVVNDRQFDLAVSLALTGKSE